MDEAQKMLENFLQEARERALPIYLKKTLECYEDRRSRGLSPEAAMLNTIATMSYIAFEQANIMPKLYQMGFSDDPKAKDEMRGILKLIEGGKDDDDI